MIEFEIEIFINFDKITRNKYYIMNILCNKHNNWV